MNRRPAVPRPADNPFSSGCIDSLPYRFHDGGAGSLLERLERNKGRGTIIGPHGSGKTTLLEDLARRLEGELIWVRLNAETENPGTSARNNLPDTVDQCHAIVIDGAEQLGAWAWWRLHRRIREAGSIIITSHRPGRFPTIHECTTNPELLDELVNELAPGAVKTVDLNELFERHDGNIRLCFRELYDLWAGRLTLPLAAVAPTSESCSRPPPARCRAPSRPHRSRPPDRL